MSNLPRNQLVHERAVDSAVSLTLASSDCTRSEDRSRACSEPRTNEPLANGSKKSSHFNEASGNVISHTKLRTCPVRKPTVFIVDVESSPAALEFCDGVTTTYMRDHVAGKGHKIIVVYTRSYKRLPSTFKIPAPKNALVTQRATNDCSIVASFFAARVDTSKSIRIVASAKKRCKYIDIIHLLRDKKCDIDLLPPNLKLFELIGVLPLRNHVKSSKRLANKLSAGMDQHDHSSHSRRKTPRVGSSISSSTEQSQMCLTQSNHTAQLSEGSQNRHTYPSTSQITLPSTESSESN